MVRELGFLSGFPNQVSLTPSQGHTLIELSFHGTLTAQQLSDLLCVDKSTVSRTVDELKSKGYLASTPNGADKRSKAISLTDVGKHILEKLNSGANTQVARTLDFLTLEERESVIRGIDLYAKALRWSRLLETFQVRLIRKQDNPQVTYLIRAVMPEFGAVGPGVSINDAEVNSMHEAYSHPRTQYLVAVKNERVVGGAGIAPLDGGPKDVCELKKMYLLPEARGMGLGRYFLQRLLPAAKAMKYKSCYLETLDSMANARQLYEKFGFEKLRAPMGNTGHFRCNHWYAVAL